MGDDLAGLNTRNGTSPENCILRELNRTAVKLRCKPHIPLQFPLLIRVGNWDDDRYSRNYINAAIRMRRTVHYSDISDNNFAAAA